MFSTQATIYNRNGWELTSYGNGAAYLLRRDNKSVFLQGDDAHLFRVAVMGDDGFMTDHCEDAFDDYVPVMIPDIHLVAA